MISIILGTQWGDEAKGKLTDYYAQDADIAVRFQGGNNAGHTIVVGDDTFKLRLIPSGVVQGKDVVLGNGMVIDPSILKEELDGLRERNVKMGTLFISERAHVIMPYHKQEDGILEELKGRHKAGTTMRGIGPCYSDKVSRIGIRFVDLIDKQVFMEKLDIAYDIKKKYFAALGQDILVSKQEIIDSYTQYADLFRPFVTDISVLLNNAEAQGKNILMEGAQATHLDIDFGIYPFNTSSNCIAGGACTGAGIPPHSIGNIMGIVKAYTTRVGTGPVPTELEDNYGKHLADKGHEFGTVTGRPRRCGWLDLMLVKYSVMINGLDGVFVTKLDVLNGLDTVKICVGYTVDGKPVDYLPSNMETFAKCVPVYKEFKGWDFDLDTVVEKGFDALPKEAKEYLSFIETELGVDLFGVSVGPERSMTLVLKQLF